MPDSESLSARSAWSRILLIKLHPAGNGVLSQARSKCQRRLAGRRPNDGDDILLHRKPTGQLKGAKEASRFRCRAPAHRLHGLFISDVDIDQGRITFNEVACVEEELELADGARRRNVRELEYGVDFGLVSGSFFCSEAHFIAEDAAGISFFDAAHEAGVLIFRWCASGVGYRHIIGVSSR
ncbi:uncharacterized protein K441DRAFT_237403 [Cenococcum geophilum 1.58]|uniref:uncharacterized protein n=1 Tax=Cenococcum geophilum 1.58 TaxID=794803 RepID=UPI00358F4851|nr:hypothetical protein K441DRAFT_237403 [Cenococcum geophilum 1.58]